MSPLSLGSVLLGLLIVATALLDIVVTALHPAAQSPVSHRFYRTVWTVVRYLSRSFQPAMRRRLLSWVLPSSIAGLLLFWLLMLMVGFALLYLPAMGQRGAFTSSSGHLGWGEALYYSGVCLTTMGFGDIVPRGGLVRALSIFEGLGGLLVASVAITYVLSVFPFLPGGRVLATTLVEETDGRLDAVPLVRRYLSVDSAEALAQRCRELSTDLIILVEAHNSHPVLFYAHPRHVEQSFLRTLLVIQRLVIILRYGLRQADYSNLIRDPRVVGLEESLITALRALGSSFHLNVQTPEEAQGQEVAGDYDRLIALLHQTGLRADTAVGRRERLAYTRFRLVTDPYIWAYAANSGYRQDELTADYPPYRGTTAPLPAEDDEEE